MVRRYPLQFVLAVLFVICLPGAYFRFLQRTPPSENSIVARAFARNTGLGEEKIYTLMTVADKLRSKRPITDEDWQAYEEASRSPHIEYRANSLVGVVQLNGTRFEGRAHDLMKRLAVDPDPGTRSIALRELMFVGDPEAPQYLRQAKASSSQFVKQTAEELSSKLPVAK